MDILNIGLSLLYKIRHQKMSVCVGSQLSAANNVYIYTYLLLTLLVTVNADRTLQNIYDKDEKNVLGFQTLWDVYILPHLELDLKQKYDNNIDADLDDTSNLSSNADEPYAHSIKTEDRQKREHFDVAGLGNLDHLSTILDRARTLPVRSRMSLSRLQQLMRKQGRRKK